MNFDDYPVQALMEVTARPSLVFLHGQGSLLYDHEGREYLDFVQGWAVNSLGHSPREIVEALTRQAAQLINCSPAFYNEPSSQLASSIVSHSCFDRVFFANSGAEANEGAIKLARKWGEKNKGGAYEIVTFEHSFHGRTLATMSASGKAGWDRLFEPKVPGFPKAKLNDLASVEALISPLTAAVMLEPIQGEAGVIPASRDFTRALRDLTQRHKVLLIVDEVQTGMGRTGRLFAYEGYEIEPDMMTLGKGIGGGVPLAALCAKEHVCVFEHGDQGGTYNGNPLMTAAGNAVFETVRQPGFLAHVRETSAYFRSELEGLSARRKLGIVRGEGLLLALELGREIGPQLVEKGRVAGLLLNSPRPGWLRFMPALNIGTEEVDRLIRTLEGLLIQLDA
ncbi:MAG TPA: acetylornithine transaminase [Burkholderiales bacterium]|nr:acetylornithine transaminase [Burkholderiales bacterium]